MRTLLLGTVLLGALLVACGGGGDSPALKAVKDDCSSPYGQVDSYVCRQALLNEAYTGSSEAVTKVECLMLHATIEDGVTRFANGGSGVDSRVRALHAELCEED